MQRLGLAVLVLWMVLGPIATQVFGVQSKFLPAWHMYRGWGSNIVVARFERVDGLTPQPVDRVELLGLGPSVDDRRLRTPLELERQIVQMCTKLPPHADLRVHARIGRIHGWKVLRDGRRSACR